MKEKSTRNIRSKFVREALVDTYNLSRSLQENTTKIVADLLKEQVKTEFDKLMREGIEDKDEEDYKEETPEITDIDGSSEKNGDMDSNDDSQDTEDGEDTVSTDDNDINAAQDGQTQDEGNGEDAWDEFDDFKMDAKNYDMRGTDGNGIAKVFKLLGPKDNVMIIDDTENGTIKIQDKANDTEYIIDLGGSDDAEPCEGGSCDNTSVDENQDIDNMNEETLKEFDSKVNYTDSYQKNDVMTNDGMKEPAPNKVNDWDKGVPKGTERPWGGEVKKTEPFDKKVNEEENVEEPMTEGEEDQLEEANLSQSRWNDTHAVHNRVPAANKDEFRRDGMQKTSKGTKYRATGSSDEVNESLIKDMRRIVNEAKEIRKENAELKEWMTKLKKLVKESYLTNMKLGRIVSILTNNTTTMQEKKDIVNRFNDKSIDTVEKAQALYETISREVKDKAPINENLNIDRQYNADGSRKINEGKVVMDKGLLESLDLMKRIQRY